MEVEVGVEEAEYLMGEDEPLLEAEVCTWGVEVAGDQAPHRTGVPLPNQQVTGGQYWGFCREKYVDRPLHFRFRC